MNRTIYLNVELQCLTCWLLCHSFWKWTLYNKRAHSFIISSFSFQAEISLNLPIRSFRTKIFSSSKNNIWLCTVRVPLDCQGSTKLHKLASESMCYDSSHESFEEGLPFPQHRSKLIDEWLIKMKNTPSMEGECFSFRTCVGFLFRND